MEQAKLVAICVVVLTTLAFVGVGFAAVSNYRRQNPGQKVWPSAVVLTAILGALDAGIAMFFFRVLAR